MCTGWGDLVCATSQVVTTLPLCSLRATQRRRDPERFRAADLGFPSQPVTGRRRGPTADPRPGNDLGTAWGRTGGGRGTAGGRPTMSVHNRRDVHVSTQAGG